MSVRLTVSWKVEGHEGLDLSYTVVMGAAPTPAVEEAALEEAEPEGPSSEELPLTSSVIFPGLSMPIG